MLGFCILFWTNSRAQGSGLLIQQYGKSNVDEIGLRKWNFDAHLFLNRFNTTDRETKGKISRSAGGSVRYNFKKSYGLRTGIDISQHQLRLQFSKRHLQRSIVILVHSYDWKAVSCKTCYFRIGIGL